MRVDGCRRLQEIPLSQPHHPPVNSVAALVVRLLIALAMFALVAIPAAFLDLIVSYAIIPLNLSPVVLNVFVGAKYAIILFDIIILSCFVYSLMLEARKQSAILQREFSSFIIETQIAIRDFIHPLFVGWERFTHFINVISNTKSLGMTNVHRVVIALAVIAGAVIAAFIEQADRFAVVPGTDGQRVSQLVGPDGTVINIANDPLVTIPKWWYGEPVQLQMSNGRTQSAALDETGISTVLARVQ